eukprot:11946950-Alexandrium_andersonii.AAC.1
MSRRDVAGVVAGRRPPRGRLAALPWPCPSSPKAPSCVQHSSVMHKSAVIARPYGGIVVGRGLLRLGCHWRCLSRHRFMAPASAPPW